MKLYDSNQRLATTLSDAVDEAIIMHEEGRTEEAMKLLSALGFKANDVHRILKTPENRRKYINDMMSGY